MRSVALQFFRLSLELLPRSFRRAYGAEMEDVFAERMRGESRVAILLLVINEISDIGIIAARARFESLASARTAIAAAIVIAMVLSTVALRDIAINMGFASNARGRIDFSAQDPAGQFTLTILEGRPIAATMNRVPLPPERIVHHGDSIHILARGGKVVLALAYYRDTGRIEWNARPAACRAHPAECETYQ